LVAAFTVLKRQKSELPTVLVFVLLDFGRSNFPETCKVVLKLFDGPRFGEVLNLQVAGFTVVGSLLVVLLYSDDVSLVRFVVVELDCLLDTLFVLETDKSVDVFSSSYGFGDLA